MMIFLASSARCLAAQTAAKLPEFQAADVRVSPHRRFLFGEEGFVRGDRYIFHQATMLELIATAYSVDESKVAAGPPWLETDRFDVVARIPPGTPPATLKLMLRSLLADRFKLQLHNGTLSQPAFMLSSAKAPVKMKQSDQEGEADCKFQEPASQTETSVVVSCHHTTMEELAQNLPDWAGAYITDPVVDATGLKGSWDFDVKWTPRRWMQKAGPDGISIFDAVEKELGLKLERQTAPRPVLIVDSVNRKPTPNAPDLARILPPMPPPQFDVAVIKPSKPGRNTDIGLDGGNLDARNATLKTLIAFAWDLSENGREELVGAPKWLDSDRFDIQAKLLDDTPASSVPNPIRVDVEELRHMLQVLLADRFQLKTHIEERPVLAYTLIAVKPKLTPADPSSRTRCKEGPGPDGNDPRIANPVLNRLVSCQNMTMAQVGEMLQTVAGGYIFQPVLDATGLKGSWNFTLSFSSAGLTNSHEISPSGTPTTAGVSASDPSGALSLFDAVNRQLGLKLEKQRRTAPVLVIDHIDEKPTAN